MECCHDNEVVTATDSCHRDNEVATATEGEMNGASDVALLATSTVGDEQLARDDENDADESDIDDHQDELTGTVTTSPAAATAVA